MLTRRGDRLSGVANCEPEVSVDKERCTPKAQFSDVFSSMLCRNVTPPICEDVVQCTNSRCD